MVPLSSPSVNAQAIDQGAICASWSQEWDISQGWGYFQRYRWCYDPLASDPSVEEDQYIEGGSWEWGEEASFCPESGTCTSPAEARG